METKLQMMRSAVSDFREDVGSGDAQAELQKHTLPGFEVGSGVQSAAEVCTISLSNLVAE